MATIAFDLVNGTNENLNSFTVTTDGGSDPANWSPGDWFGVAAYGSWPQAAGVPFAIADDSVAPISGSIFAGDTLGIIDSTTAPTDTFFSSVDTVNGANPTGLATATWTFDISNATNLMLSIDMAAMGDFEASGDFYNWSYSIDGAPFFQSIFESTVDEAGSQSYTMESGANPTLNDPLVVNGVTLNDEFQTLTAAITGTGSTLTLQLDGNSDGGSEAYAAQNIVITGDSAPAAALISEFQPNPDGTDPATVTFELSGTPGDTFDGFIVSIESDPAGANPGDINNFEAVSGTFDANGLLTVDINDLENPSFTVALLSDFTGDASTDIDTDDDGLPDDLSTFGTVLDAIGVPDTAGDESLLYGTDLGGTDFAFTGAEPELIFRDGSTGDLYAVNNVFAGTEVFDVTAASIDPTLFNTNPIVENTFGAINPTLGGGTAASLISEFQPNPTGTDPALATFELSGTPGEQFSGVIVSIESDPGTANPGDINNFEAVSGTFDANGLLTVDINDLENPSFTVALLSDFTGDTSTDIDTDDDGVPDDLSTFGTVFDAIGVPDTAGDESLLYGTDLGGTDFTFTGDEPRLVFRSGSTGDLYAVNDPDNGQVFDVNGTAVAPSAFDTDPTAGTDTFGAINPTFVGGNNDIFDDRFIHEIQGETNLADGTLVGVSGAADESPLLGNAVRVQAVVTQVLPGLGGFYVQEEDADADTNDFTSEGIFIASSSAIAEGDLVTIEGTVAEVEGETRINASGVTVDANSNPLPTATEITFPTATVLQDADGDFVANLEAFEGMLVTVPEAMSVTELFQLDRFGTIRISSEGRLEQFTQNSTPSVAGFEQHLMDIAARSLIIDDGQNNQNPNPIQVPDLGTNGTLDNGDVFRMGDTYTGLTGVLSYSEDDQTSSEEPEYRLHTPTGTLNQANPRPTEPNDVGGSLKVASFNVLNFFTTLDTFPTSEQVGPNSLSPRGADTNPQNAVPGVSPTDEYDRQLAKLVEALVDADSDVIGLVELENDFAAGGASPQNSSVVQGSGVAIQELVDAVNAQVGAGTYDWVRPTTGEFVGGDAIAVGFIYDTTTVNLVGDSAVLETFNGVSFLDPNNTGTGRNRAALAQTFEETASGETFTATVNHFKSKGSSGLSGGPLSNPDVDQGDGQGFWNDTRTDAANLLADWLATDPTGSGDSDYLILGDLNAYANEDPITALESKGYTDLAEALIGDEAYSFVFDGQTGTLDYALANPEMFSQVTGATEWHINADEPDAFDYNLEFGRDPSLLSVDPFRASDHDPVIIGLNLESPLPDNAFWFSTDKVVELDDTRFSEEDIVQFDGTTFTTYLDGSEVGLLGANIDAFDIISDTEVLLSLDRAFDITGIGEVDDSDIVKYDSVSGSFESVLKGSDIGLTRGGEDIDALTRLEDGSLLISTTSNASFSNGLRAKDEDLVLFNPNSGDISLYVDGSDIGLTKGREDVDAVTFKGDELLLSTIDRFQVSGLSGNEEDVFGFTPSATGNNTDGTFGSELFFDGSEFGFNSVDIDAVDSAIG